MKGYKLKQSYKISKVNFWNQLGSRVILRFDHVSDLQEIRKHSTI